MSGPPPFRCAGCGTEYEDEGKMQDCEYAHASSGFAVRGGWDGVVFTFGEGFDSNSLQTFLDRIFGWNVKLTLSNGDEIECQLRGVTRVSGYESDDDLTHTLLDYEVVDEDEQPVELSSVDFDAVVNIHVF